MLASWVEGLFAMFRFFRRLFGWMRRRKPSPSPALPPSESQGSVDGVETNNAASERRNRQPSTPAPSTPATGVSSPDLPSPENSALPDDKRPSAPLENSQPSSPPVSSMSPSSESSASATSPIENLKQVLNVLRAYVVTFGRPASEIELRAVIGAIVANLTTITIENSQLERFMDDAVAAFESLGTEASLVDVTAQLLAEQVSVWLREQESTVQNVVSAYLQQFAPDDAVWNSGEVISLVQTVIATLNDGSLSNSGGQVLVDRVIKAFDLEQSLSRWVAPEWVALAQRVANYVQHGDLQSEVRSIAWSYIQQFKAILSPQLIEQIAQNETLNVSPSEFLSGDLGEFSQMLYYKFQLLDADPVVTKSHEAIAANVHEAIAALQAQREPGLDVTKGIQSGDLEISSPLRRTGRS